MIRHLYFAFWRPDIRDKLAEQGSPIVAMCDFIGNGESVVNDTREVTCPACRETFLQALPTGDGTKTTWEAYLASPQAAPRVTLAQRAKEADAADAAWSTAPGGLANADLAGVERKVMGGWSTGAIQPDPPTVKGDPGAWSTGPAAPNVGGWKTS